MGRRKKKATRSVIRNKSFYNDKRIKQKEIAIPNVYVSCSRALKQKTKMTNQDEFFKSTIIMMRIENICPTLLTVLTLFIFICNNYKMIKLISSAYGPFTKIDHIYIYIWGFIF